MSVQLVLYPQNYQGIYLNPNLNEYVSDGLIFSLLNNYTGYDVPTTSVNPSYDSVVNSLPISAWKRFRSTNTTGAYGLVDMPNKIGGELYLYSSNTTTYSSSSGVYQYVNNLSIGSQYEISINITQASTNSGHLSIGNPLLPTLANINTLGNLNHTFSTAGAGVVSLTFTASNTQELLLLEYRNYNGDTIKIGNINVKDKVNSPSNIYADISDGQVICDIYEEEDIPLSLSVDDFKNVAEKVQSYSKDFNLPATKRNNKIFTHLFDVTKIQDAFSFNPYVKTQCILKQDGYNIFEGYLKLLDIVNKEGEISYSVNLYSENVELKEVLENKKFRDLNFTELTHDYNKTNIKASWYDSTGITLTNPLNTNSNAYNAALGVNNTTVLKYPFVDWTGSLTVDNNTNFPVLNTLEDAFRPFINCKYILKQIFDDTNFTYTSNFFDGALFSKIFMDFNWGADNSPNDIEHTGDGTSGSTSFIPVTHSNVPINSVTLSGDFGYDTSNYKFTALYDNITYQFNYAVNYEFVSAGGIASIETRWVHKDSVGNLAGNGIINVDSGTGGGNFQRLVQGTITETLNIGDTLELQSKASSANEVRYKIINQFKSAFINGSISINSMTNSVILNTLRGDLGQWEFLKSLINMFNLIIYQDKENANNLVIEPYSEVFIKNTSGTSLASRGVLYDWTDKIDVTEIKLSPLDLVKTTLFKYADDDSYPNNYYRNVTQIDYGSYKFTNPDLTLLTGEDEVSVEPFAASVMKPLFDYLSDFIVPVIFSSNDDNTEFESFENNPRILFNVSPSPYTLSGGAKYIIPTQNGVTGEQATEYLRFSHTSEVISSPTGTDLNFGQIQLINMGVAPVDNLYNTYWSPYYNELYNPDTKYMTLKVNLNASDINQFNFFDQVMIKNKNYRVNKIEYKPNELSTVEFILIG